MSIKHVVLIALIFPFFVCTSCITSNKNIGTSFATDDLQLISKKVSFDIPLTLATPDSIQSYSTTTMLVGEIKNKLFGTAKSGSVSFIIPSSDTCFLGFDPKLINAYAIISIDSTFTTIPSQEGMAQNITLYKLTSDIDTTKMFNTSFASTDFDPKPISVGSSVYYGEDSIKIMISDEYAEELLRTSQKEFDSTDLFIKRMKGIYMTATTASTNAEGGRLNYIPVSKSYIRVNYQLTDPGQGFLDHDTSQVFVLGYYSAINTLTNTSSHLATSSPSDYLYMDCWSGVKPKIKGETIKGILQNWAINNGFDNKRVIIARAYLTFPFETPEDFNNVDNYPDLIYPCTVAESADSVRFFYPLSEIYSNTYKGALSRSLKHYTCDITSYVQEVISTDKILDSSKDLWIMPIRTVTDESSGTTYYNFDTINYSYTILNGPNAADKPTLSIWYSVINY